MTEEMWWFWFGNIPDMWQGKMRRLLMAFGHPRELYFAGERALRAVPGLKEKDITRIREAQRNNAFEKQYERMQNSGIRLYYPGHRDFPKRLLALPDCPYTLYVKGELPDEKKPAVAIVGARQPSPYGICMTERLAKSLAAHGIQTISGLAKGIDGACHRGTIEGGGRTFAVLGNGVDICYPRGHRKLYEDCIRQGGIMSEYPPGREPFAWQFPLRNRLISGLGDILVVMEAKEKSGSLITVDYALDQGKDVFALPGRVSDETNKGCNRLIRAGAMILTDTADILEALGIEENRQTTERIVMSEGEKRLYEALDFAPEDVGTIAERAGMPCSEAAALLTNLVLKGVAGEQMNCFFQKKLL